MFETLSDSIKESIDQFDGFITGKLIVDNGEAYILSEDGEEIDLEGAKSIEVRTYNGERHEYHEISYDEARTKMSTDGWSLYAGLYCRVKREE